MLICVILGSHHPQADVMLYVNATGLMWENAAEFKAMIVFAEHRCCL